MEEYLKKLGFKRLPPEEKYYSVVPGLLRRIKNLYENIYKEFGADGLELIRKNSDEYGKEIGRRVKARGELKGIYEVGSFLIKVFDNVAENWEITYLDENKLVIRVPKCPYPFESVAICKAHIQMERSLIKSLDENLDYWVGKSIPSGDDYCEHILVQKGNLVINR